MAEQFLGGNYTRNRNADHQLPIGTVLGGQYMIGKALGQGGFGITYLAWDQTMGEPVAVKEYFPKGFASRTAGNTKVTSYDGQNAHDFEFNKKRFLREAESLAKLWNIPQIVKILRYFEENGTAYIVMEYVQGVDLRQHLKKQGRPLTMEETLALMGPVVEGLDLVHKINLVHRDISPDNIMVLPDGSTKLLDFGAARYVENADAEQQRQSSTQQVLKHGFAPPEQYSSHGALGPWTDVYALCGTVYYCLTGKLPPEAMDRGYSGAVIPWDRIPDLTPGQKAALEKGMALQPKERFASARELWEQLKKETPRTVKTRQPEQHDRTERTQAPKASKTNKHPRKGKKLLAVFAAAALVVLLCFIFGNRLEIPSDLDLSGVELGYTEAIPVLSKHDAADIQWTSSNPQAASVSGNGVITAVGFGTSEITAQYKGQQVVCTVSVDLSSNIACTFEENETGWTITGYEGDKENLPEIVILPDKKDGKPVTAIANYAFRGCSRMTSVTIPNGIVSLGNAAFGGCNSLASVTIPGSVASIGDSAFYGCSRLTKVTIQDGVTSIGDSVFKNCNNLSSVTIPDSITFIGADAFQSCNGLTSVTVSSNCQIAYGAFPGRCTVNRSNSGGGDIFTYAETSTGWTITGYKGDKAYLPTSVVLPGEKDGKPVTSIADYAFQGCSRLTKVAIPNSVTSIGNSAFRYCSCLTNVTIPDSVTSIGRWAFYGSSLTSVTVPKDCKISSEAFPDTCTVNRR